MKNLPIPIFLWIVSLSILLGLISGFQILGDSQDYSNYSDFFDMVRNTDNYIDIKSRFEIGFTILTFFWTQFISNNAIVYSLIIIPFIFIKFLAIERNSYSPTILIFFIFYFITRYFPLYEITQLRAACALSLVFFVFYNKKNTKICNKDIILLLIAILFHYSSSIFLLIYLLNPKSKLSIILIPTIAFIFIFIVNKLLFTTLSNYLLHANEYAIIAKQYSVIDPATPLPIPYIVDISFFTFAFVYFESANTAMRYSILGFFLSVAFHFAFINYAVFSIRYRELLSIFILIYVLHALNSSSYTLQRVSIFYIILTGILYLYINFFYSPLLIN